MPNTPPPWTTMAASSGTRYSGTRAWNSSRATASSSRARWEPRQRCGPAPKATWRLAAAVEVDLVGVVELGRVARCQRRRQQDAVPGLHPDAGAPRRRR